MVVLKQSSCSAAIAFSPSAPYLATGTSVGTTDMNFNDFSVLEIRSADFSEPGKELRVVGGPVPTSAQFHALAWSKPLDSIEGKQGLVAGSLSDGTLAVWDGSKLIDAPSQSKVSSLANLGKQPGAAVRALAFNTLQSHQKLATGGYDGQITIWDLARPRTPISKPAVVQGGANGKSAGETTAVAWNNVVDHILATASSGSTSIWDLRSQKHRYQLRDTNRSPHSVSALAWHPSAATQIVVAYADDKNPVLQMWDLRRSGSPVFEFAEHQQGVLGLSWCSQDATMLLSAGRDCRTILWDKSGVKLGECTSSSYNLDVAWSPTNPGVFATSSCAGAEGQDAAVTLHSLTSLTPVPYVYEDGSLEENVPLQIVPTWLKRPAGCSFGFGGKLVTFGNEIQKVEGGFINKANATMRTVISQDEAVGLSPEFEETIAAYDYSVMQQYCEHKLATSRGEDAETWKFLSLYTQHEDRSRKILEYLGFEHVIPEPEASQNTANVEEAAETLEALQLNSAHEAAPPPPQPRMPVPLPEPEGDGMDFFDEDPTSSAATSPKLSPRLAPIAAPLPKPPAPKEEAKTPKVQTGPQEDKLEDALYAANYAAAINICLEANRMTDALIIGNLGGGPHFARAQSEVMKRQPFRYMQFANAVLQGDLLGFIKSHPVTAWRKTLAAIFSHAASDEVQSLCDALARHLYQNKQVHAAILCWICAGNVDQTVRAWTQSLKTQGSESSRLQTLVERSVFFQTAQLDPQPSSALSELLSQFAGLLASQGHMTEAMRYLNMVQTDATGPAAVLKFRLYHSGLADSSESEPAYPFNEESYAEDWSTQQPTNAVEPSTSQTPAYNAVPQSRANGGGASNFFSENAYTTSGRYGGGNTPTHTPAPPPPPLSQPGAFASVNSQPHQTSSYGGNLQRNGSGAAYNAKPAFQPPQQPPAFQPPQQQPAFQSPPTHQNHDQGGHAWGNQQHSSARSAEWSQQSAYGNTQPAYASQPPITQSSHASHPSTNHSSLPPTFSNSSAQPSYSESTAAPPAPYNPAAAAAANTFHQPPAKPVTVAQPSVFVPTRTSAPKAPVGGGSFVTPTGGSSQATAYQMQPAQSAAPVAAPSAPSEPPRPVKTGPPANITVTSADVSKVSGDNKIIVQAISTAYSQYSAATAHMASKKRELEDTGKRLGQLFWKLNAGELSEGVLADLRDLSLALQSQDFVTAIQKQLQLTRSSWTECSAFITALKRLIKAVEQLAHGQ